VQQDPLPQQVAVAAILPNAWLRGVVDLGRMRRLSDVLNHVAAGYLPVVDGELMPSGAREWPRPRPRLYVNKADLLFVHPTANSSLPAAPPGLTVSKLRAPVGLYVGEYLLEGIVHVADRVPWEQYLSVVRDRFLAITEASIVRVTTGEPVESAGFVAVNREHVTALYPL
jgi:hypothetical protein